MSSFGGEEDRRKREAEIRRKIKILKTARRIKDDKNNDNDKASSTNNQETSRAVEAKADRIMSDLEKTSPSASQDYADKIRTKLASAEGARREVAEEARKEREEDRDMVEDVARRLREKKKEELAEVR